jgi:hypothetical protein
MSSDNIAHYAHAHKCVFVLCGDQTCNILRSKLFILFIIDSASVEIVKSPKSILFFYDTEQSMTVSSIKYF